MGRMEKTIRVTADLHERLEDLKPYDSMTFNELIEEMADAYEESEMELAADGGQPDG